MRTELIAKLNELALRVLDPREDATTLDIVGFESTEIMGLFINELSLELSEDVEGILAVSHWLFASD